GVGSVSKLTPKEDAYARARADRKGPSDSYRSSRDATRMAATTIAANAKRLERKPAIKARIEELKGGESPDAESRNFGAANRLMPQEECGGQGVRATSPSRPRASAASTRWAAWSERWPTSTARSEPGRPSPTLAASLSTS